LEIEFTKQARHPGVHQALSALRSHWQRASIKLVINSRQWECLDYVIILNETSPRRQMKAFLAYYHESGTRLLANNDTPQQRPVHPPERGPVVAIPQIGGHHRQYERRAA
jgi:hypothetical protein